MEGYCPAYSVGNLERRQLKLRHAWHWFVLLSTTVALEVALRDDVYATIDDDDAMIDDGDAAIDDDDVTIDDGIVHPV